MLLYMLSNRFIVESIYVDDEIGLPTTNTPRTTSLRTEE